MTEEKGKGFAKTFINTAKRSGFWVLLSTESCFRIEAVWPARGPVPRVDWMVGQEFTTMGQLRKFIKELVAKMKYKNRQRFWDVETVNLCRVDQIRAEAIAKSSGVVVKCAYATEPTMICGKGLFEYLNFRLDAGTWSFKEPPWGDIPVL